ncbi:hypothetical protein [Nocardiopsis composta]|uniref:DUF4352 domain-containing protein n=1 Tax=Nocardiopsis composta TaxID=157465 RepID=A0A7W8QQD4_9ACTN|nr:hypothetical protein [Nocardiopsis composta]MBB5433686.1 hypothetical protein [Nocardiopsis composta]
MRTAPAPRPDRRRSGRASTVLASAVLLALLLGAQALRIHDDEARTAPMEVSGTASEAVDARSFTVEVVDVAFARSVYDASRLSVGDEDEADAAAAEDAIEANGVWVVVTADITAAERPLNRVNAELETGEGTTYSSSTMSVNALGSISDVFSPGIPRRGAVVFELPPERLSSPSVRFNVHSGLDKRLSGSALVDLELSGSELKKAVDGAEEALAVPQSEIRKA